MVKVTMQVTGTHVQDCKDSPPGIRICGEQAQVYDTLPPAGLVQVCNLAIATPLSPAIHQDHILHLHQRDQLRAPVVMGGICIVLGRQSSTVGTLEVRVNA
jgi:hypothetical protein